MKNSRVSCWKMLFSTVLISFFATSSFSQPGLVDSSRVPVPAFHYESEYNFDQPSDSSSWKELPPGLHVAFGSTDEIYFRREVPPVPGGSNTWEAIGWKGERLNAVLVTWAAEGIEQVRVTIGALKSSTGSLIPAGQVRFHLVRNVLSNYPYNAGEVSCGPGPVDRAFLLPDRLEAFDRYDLPARSVRSVWISVDIPRAAAPGEYSGVITIATATSKKELKVRIRVQDQVLPEPRDWSFRLDLWQNPWVLAEYYKVKPWSPGHLSLLKSHLKHYADAGGKFITTYAVHSPWADNSYMIEGTMIEWIRRKNGQWKFDYTIFDQYVQLAMSVGIDKAITIYTPIPWGERFRFLDEASGNYVYERWLPTSDSFRVNWNAFLSDLKSHLERKGWFSRTYIGINENAMEQTLTAIRVLKKHSPKWRITYAGDWHPELDTLLDDYSCVYGKEPSFDSIRLRSSRKQTTTYYVCCTPPKPNSFVFSPPVEARWLGWYAFAAGYDGFLRWAYDAWPADPVRDARHFLWPAGDCFMVYPGAATGIRFEKMREGIVDFEKIRILTTKASGSTDKKVRELVAALQARLSTFREEKSFVPGKLSSDIRKAGQTVAELSDRLAEGSAKKASR